MKARHSLVVTGVYPSRGVPGGTVTLECEGFEPDLPSVSSVLLGDVQAEIISASSDRVTVRLPESPSALGINLRVRNAVSPVFPFALATVLAGALHPVTSPAVAPDGTIITTISGSRGEQTTQPLVRVTPQGEKIPFSCDITNPTGLAFSRDGQLYISSRNDGTILRYTNYEDLDVVAEDLGTACGIVFDSQGYLYVGDRTGRIYRVDVESGTKTEHAQLEPSVSAYHLAIDSRDRLYVTGPTFSMRDALYCIPAPGEVEVVLRGLGRPQGMAFMPSGELLITAGFEGNKGVFRYSLETGDFEHYIAGPILVGVATSKGGIVLASSDSIFLLEPPGYNSRVS